MNNYPLLIEDYIPKYLANKLRGASPEEICSFYVQNFILKNGEWFKGYMAEHNLPKDFLKLHKRIEQMAVE